MDNNQSKNNREYGDVENSYIYIKQLNIDYNTEFLEIGCNYGSLLNILHRNGYKNLVGVDINEKSIGIGREKYTEISGKLIFYDGIQLPFGDNRFDIVLMFDVIEHIPGAQEFLKNEVFRVLKHNGRFIFQTPNKLTNIPWEIIQTRSLICYKKYHCSLQTCFSLKKLLIQSGFGEITIEKFNNITDYNSKKIKGKIGVFGTPLLFLLNKAPLYLYTNFWGHCRKQGA